jgi:hypothetical protein
VIKPTISLSTYPKMLIGGKSIPNTFVDVCAFLNMASCLTRLNSKKLILPFLYQPFFSVQQYLETVDCPH